MAEKATKGGKKGRKIGRNKLKCERYRAAHRREKNMARRAGRYLLKHPNDEGALGAINNNKAWVRTAADKALGN